MASLGDPDRDAGHHALTHRDKEAATGVHAGHTTGEHSRKAHATRDNDSRHIEATNASVG